MIARCSGRGKKKFDGPLPRQEAKQIDLGASLLFQLNLPGFASVAYITSKAGIRYQGAGADDSTLIGALPALGLLKGEFACESEPAWS